MIVNEYQSIINLRATVKNSFFNAILIKNSDMA